MRSFTIAATAGLTLLAGTASAGVRFDLLIFENADGVDTSGIDAWVEVNDLGGGMVSFTFGNDSADGDVTTVYVESTGLLTGGSIVNNADVAYGSPGTPPNPPGSVNGFFGGAWGGNLFLADPDVPNPVANALNPGETFDVQFALNGGTFNDVIDAMSGGPAGFRVVAHIQRIGAGDASIWGATPTPGSGAALALAGVIAAGRRRR